MEYKGYSATVEFDEGANILHGEVAELRDVVTFEASNVADLRTEFARSVEDYLTMCAERGELPERTYSGRLLLRLAPALHRSLAVAAQRQAISLNEHLNALLASAGPSPDTTPDDWDSVTVGVKARRVLTAAKSMLLTSREAFLMLRDQAKSGGEYEDKTVEEGTLSLLTDYELVLAGIEEVLGGASLSEGSAAPERETPQET